MLGKVFKVQIKLDPGMLCSQNSSKPPKMPYFGSFSLFDTLLTNFLTRTNLILPKNHCK